MTKATAAAGVGATGTILTGGAYVLGAFDSKSNPHLLDIPLSLEEGLKKETKIISSYFPDLSFKEEGEAWATDKPKTDFLGTQDNEARGRLVVNWEKYRSNADQSDKKWSGGIR